MIRLILSDLDNTLAWAGEHVVTPYARAAIHAAQAAGVRFAPATGRAPSALDWMFDSDEACLTTVLASNGQLIYVDGRLVHEAPLDLGVLRRCAGALDGMDDAWLVLDYIDTGEQYAVRTPRDYLEGHRVPYFFMVTRSVDEVPDRPVVKANVRVVGDFVRGREVRSALKEACPELDFVFPMQERPHIDLLPAGWDKGAAGEWLAQNLGLANDEVCCFGDAENDLSLFARFKNSVAVANATPAVAMAARWHIGRADEDAVADVILDIARSTAAGEMPSFMRG
ncbi:MAG: Cof-type HAD-IIB family hydrolase [Coriobacteriaceae bacterium]|uniref:HAD family hydrolase n=1 Tax=Tractidigestivibacter sp. TaxID=2847320 RepID=UPI002A81A1F5|nr:HAD family hydrolase [Tractidigestivibacter sp.]MCI6844896.1 Cof-type HAD-IIB family hydrolase [Coriobacteriaceae bacterium]MDD7583381.1 HAD family hydrolase [Coriobacteriaceae bacterium]MDY4533638.1 HAD family hydrolase [Tractidigestivibacter sp.]